MVFVYVFVYVFCGGLGMSSSCEAVRAVYLRRVWNCRPDLSCPDPSQRTRARQTSSPAADVSAFQQTDSFSLNFSDWKSHTEKHGASDFTYRWHRCLVGCSCSCYYTNSHEELNDRRDPKTPSWPHRSRPCHGFTGPAITHSSLSLSLSLSFAPEQRMQCQHWAPARPGADTIYHDH